MASSRTAKSALLVVDMQEDFCPPAGPKNGALAVPGGRDIAPTINHLLSLPFDIKIATRDFHPPDHVSFSTSHSPPDNIPFQSFTTISNPTNISETTTIPIWPPHCVRDTPGAKLIPEILSSRFDRIIDKGCDRRVEMFSAFADAFGNKSEESASVDLAAYLKGEKVMRVFVVGLTGEYCVRCTAIDAWKEDFEVFVVEEGVRSVEQEGERGWEGAKKDMGKLGIGLVSIDGQEVKKISE
ncbi:MAG: hypothetical protein Q9177_006475 [Variospora cf. flavescens]